MRTCLYCISAYTYDGDFTASTTRPIVEQPASDEQRLSHMYATVDKSSNKKPRPVSNDTSTRTVKPPPSVPQKQGPVERSIYDQEPDHLYENVKKDLQLQI